MTSEYKELTNYQKTTLDNGVRVITETVPYVQSISMGIWVHSGSRYERPEVNGICHFIEHMLFKGTDKRSAFTIAKEIDSVGGVLNAFTSKELTSFYCRVLSENTELAVDLLADIFLNASFPDDEIEREKQVVCQEIHQLEDSPEDLVHEILGIRFWRDDPLGQPILGTIPNIVKLDRNTLVGFKNQYYTPDETLICAAGKLEHDAFVQLVERHTGKFPRSKADVYKIQPKSDASAHVEERDLEQVHVCIGMDGPSAVDPRRHAGYILNAVLGGGMSSRLFQEVREKRGLAYAVYSFLSSFSDTGIFGIYAGCDPERLQELLNIMGKETLELSRSITADDVSTAKSQIKGNIILAMESTDSRMNRLAKGEYYFGRRVGVDEILAALEAVTLDELRETADWMINEGRYTIVAVGPVGKDTDLFGYFRGL
ncbi:MAG: insulinase family protein [Desulfomonile tiedjei]|uniref:Insulinase family protein n=1 Tax=Desulfomonile tiedjei TaxID=2358 RepID=A0A9D6Z2W2_9BACT|nr:insulinase family protein [Desulfomonile tiedjei]